jgi:serine/threonine protein kinase
MARVGPDPIDDPKSGAIPRAGDVIADKYRVERVLGIGGMGVVVLVTHIQLGEPYAIKCLLPTGASDAETVERFMREARAAVRIKSEHIARVSDVGQLPNGSPYILMEYLVGRDLADVLREQGPLSIRDAVEYVLQACTGIAEAHALGIVHRDLKPSNLFLTQRLDGAALVKVLDFGISKAMGDAGPHKPSLTQTSSVFGSPAYMSPEQIRSAKNVDFRTDIWALGVILYELLTADLPFMAETAGGLLSAIAADEPHRLRARRPDVTEELDAVVRRCLEKKTQQRFQTVSELATALEPFRAGDSLVSVGRIRRLSGAPSPSNRHVHLAAPPSSSRVLGSASVDVGAATDKAWITAPRHAKPSRLLVLLVVAAAVATIAVGGVYAVARSGAARSTASTPTAPTAAEPLPPPASTAAPVVSGAPSIAPSPSVSAPPPTTTTKPGAARPAPPHAQRPAAPAATEPPTPAAPIAPASVTPAAAQPLGPTDTSH